MGRGWKILLGVLGALLVLMLANAYFTDRETKSAEVTVPGGRILQLEGGDVQVVEGGPRNATPIVLLHCFTCSINWWDAIRPALEREHRVIAIDLLGFGGSEKPESGYAMETQAVLVSEALEALHVSHATLVGHSLGGSVAVATLETSPKLINRIVIVDQAPDSSYGDGLPFTATLTFQPVIGETLWRLVPDSEIEKGLSEAFAPGYDVPERFVEDFHRMTYSSYDDSAAAEDDYTGAYPLDKRLRGKKRPLLAIFGSEEQLYDPERALAAYAALPGARTELVEGAGHSPNVEAPARTAALILDFARPVGATDGHARHGLAKKHAE